MRYDKAIVFTSVVVLVLMAMFCGACSPAGPSSMCASMTGPGTMTIGAQPVSSCPDDRAQHKVGL